MTTSPSPSPTQKQETERDRSWTVVLWNDPVNLVTYVIWVLRRVFGYTETVATQITMEAHNEGRAAVMSGPLEKAEIECYRLHRYGLWASLEH